MSFEAPVVKITHQDLRTIAQVHSRAFPESALTRLGLEAVRRFYEWQLSGPHDHEFVGIRRDGNLLGYAVGGVSRGAMAGFVRRNRGFLVRRVMLRPWLVCTCRFRGRLKLGLGSLARRKPSPPPAQPKAAGRSFGILAIAVDPAAQGLGLGKNLMNHLEGLARAQGFDRMHLTVAVNNSGAIAFYERLGWMKHYSGGEWAGGMTKRLSAEGSSQREEAQIPQGLDGLVQGRSLLASAATAMAGGSPSSSGLAFGSQFGAGGQA
jgi:ribosomal protein S18 acetylase RimI-like enzyme